MGRRHYRHELTLVLVERVNVHDWNQ
jgi:hypothetical protein